MASSRAAARMANTPFVARMDADDIARSDRLELQLRGLLSVPDATAIGSLHTFIDASGTVLRDSTRRQLLGKQPQLVHPSLMYRREVMERIGGYRDGTELFEDGDLLSRLGAAGPLLMLAEPLIAMRMATQSFRAQGQMLDMERKLTRSFEAGDSATGRNVDPVIYHTIALLTTYRGERPHILFRAMQRMRLRPLGPAIRTLLLLTLGSLSPAIARKGSYIWAALGDLLASRTIARDHLYAWRDGALQDLGVGFHTEPLPESNPHVQ